VVRLERLWVKGTVDDLDKGCEVPSNGDANRVREGVWKRPLISERRRRGERQHE